MFPSLTLALILALAAPASKPKDMPPVHAEFTRTQDVVYGRAHGTALTMDVFEPKQKPNGAIVIWVVSGGWFSSHEAIQPDSRFSPVRSLIDRGYRVCAVVHRSSPYFNIEDAIADVTRSIRFIRHQAAQVGRTTIPIGIIGGSAGGHLSLVAATAGDDGNPKSQDPVEKASSRVQAAACFFPPTDFLNYGETGVNVMDTTVGLHFPASFNFREKNQKKNAAGVSSAIIEPTTNSKELKKILRKVSPATHVTSDDAPSLMIHGDNDMLVPIQQSELIVEKLKNAGVKAQLIRRPGQGHGWVGIDKDNLLLIDWMDDHLK